jgi:hypothetical protein
MLIHTNSSVEITTSNERYLKTLSVSGESWSNDVNDLILKSLADLSDAALSVTQMRWL